MAEPRVESGADVSVAPTAEAIEQFASLSDPAGQTTQPSGDVVDAAIEEREAGAVEPAAPAVDASEEVPPGAAAYDVEKNVFVVNGEELTGEELHARITEYGNVAEMKRSSTKRYEAAARRWEAIEAAQSNETVSRIIKVSEMLDANPELREQWDKMSQAIDEGRFIRSEHPSAVELAVHAAALEEQNAGLLRAQKKKEFDGRLGAFQEAHPQYAEEGAIDALVAEFEKDVPATAGGGQNTDFEYWFDKKHGAKEREQGLAAARAVGREQATKVDAQAVAAAGLLKPGAGGRKVEFKIDMERDDLGDCVANAMSDPKVKGMFGQG